ncbi:hypothetical protein BDP27DRAFT_711013 [Rhodocollybia butyracea]|uniref:Uncharacterized protein n=1 Tax=Rhodocollybia butyracea TaxID=206335 RepID=A0A9P5Q962_9AGAR|nr:hypothetical protein BDP27DRAFT_711013 [Rhodocollybia butyracea]
MATAQGLHYGNPYATHPVQPQSWTQPQPPSSSPHMQSRRSSHPQIQQEPRSRSHSPFRPALTQRSSSSPHPLSQVQMPPQQQSAPFETQMQRHSVQSQPAPEGLHLLSHALQPIPIDLLSPTEHLQPPSTSDAQIAPASAPSGNTEKSIAGPAPPTPPRSIKSLSPEQEQHHCLPFTRAQPMKRGSIDMDYDAKEEDMSSKRMRLEDGSGHAIDSHLSEVVQEVSAMQGIEQGRTPLTPTAPGWPAERTPEGVAQVQDVQSSECTEYMEQDASNKKEDFVTDDLMNVPSKPSQSMVAQGRSDGEGPGTPGSGEDQADENEAEGESDDESEGNPEAEALEVVLKLEDSKKFCTLCR